MSLPSRPERTGLRSRKWAEASGTIGAGIAESDLGVAPVIATALHTMVDDGLLAYLPDELARDAAISCSDLYARRHGWRFDPSLVRLVPDVLTGLSLMLERFSDRAAPVIVPTPCYPPFLKVPLLHGRRVVEVPVGEDALDVARIEQALTPGSVLILCNPHNPRGTVATRTELRQLAEAVDRRGARVFSDEIHAPVVYPPATHVPYASVSDAAADHTITATSPSKGWNVAGLKSAQLVLSAGRDRLAWDREPPFPVQSGSILGAAAISAAYSTAGEQWLDELLMTLDQHRRDLDALLRERLPRAVHRPPQATYLAWIGLGAFDLPRPTARFLHERCAVSVLDGAACASRTDGYIRFNFATEWSNVERAIASIADGIARRD